ncbi:MAG: zinc ribbon domain-containing protein [Clostridia bacterium]|nr:zinc ribbon domain-containing protein [Clostridia bacterium]
MKKCTSCGAVMNDSDKFCTNCGSASSVPVEPEKPELPAEPEVPAEPVIAEAAAAEAPAFPPEPEKPAYPTEPEIKETAQETPYVNTAAVAQQPEKPKKKKTGLIVGIIAALAVIAAVLFFIKCCGGKSKPIDRFRSAQERFMAAEVMDSETSIEQFLRGKAEVPDRNISTDASLRLDIPGLDLLGTGADIISDFELAFNIDRSTDSGLFGGAIKYKGSPVLSVTVVPDGDRLGIYIPELSDEYYSLDPKLLLGMFTAVDIDGLDRLDGAEAEELLAEFDYETVSDLSRAYDDIKARYEAIIMKGLEENDFVDGEELTALRGFCTELSGAKTVVYTPNAERLGAMLKELGAAVKEDEALSNYVLSLIEHYFGKAGVRLAASLIASVTAEDDDKVFGDDDDKADLSRGIMPILEKLGKALEEKGEEAANLLSENHFEWTCVVRGSDTVAQYMTSDKLDLWVETPDEYNSFVRLNDKENGEATVIKANTQVTDGKLGGNVTFDVTGGDTDVHSLFTLEGVDKSQKSAFGARYGTVRGSFDIAEEGEEPESFGFEVIVEPDENGGTRHSIVIKDINIEDMEDLPERIGLILTTTDQPSTVKAPEIEKTLIENEEQLSEVLGEMVNNLEAVLMRLLMRIQFGSALGGN